MKKGDFILFIFVIIISWLYQVLSNLVPSYPILAFGMLGFWITGLLVPIFMAVYWPTSCNLFIKLGLFLLWILPSSLNLYLVWPVDTVEEKIVANLAFPLMLLIGVFSPEIGPFLLFRKSKTEDCYLQYIQKKQVETQANSGLPAKRKRQ